MGIRFACHICDKQLNIKQELAGRRGVCPACSSKFRIPLEDALRSTPIESDARVSVAAAQGAAAQAATGGTAGWKDAAQPLITSRGGENRGNLSPAEAADALSTSLLDDDGDATWYVRPPSGGQYGPATGAVLREWIKEGRVASTALLWRDGWPQWRDASEALPELAVHLPQGNTPPENATTRAAASLEKAPPSPQSPELSGQPAVGAQRRDRSMRRVFLIGLLSVVALTLIAVLVIVANR
jgi:hypothetical protein